MRRITLLIGITFSLISIDSWAQNEKLIARVSKEICNCLNKYDNLRSPHEIEAAMESCIIKASMKNYDAIKKELGIDMAEGDIASRQFGEVVAYELIRKCDSFLKYIMMISLEEEPQDTSYLYEEYSFQNPDLVPYEKFSTDTMHVTGEKCLSTRNAKFIYESENQNRVDYFILDNKLCTEYHDNGKYISRYHIKWKSDCEYESIFIDSTNPEINNLLTKGDKIYYQILGVYDNKVFINLDYKGFSKTFKMTIHKL